MIFIPLQMLLLVVFLLSDTIHWILARFRDLPGDSSSTADRTLCSVVILNWNGRHLLEECLPPLLEEIQNTGKPHEVIVVDNGSTDNSVSWVKGRYPWVTLVELAENLGFGEGNNRGVEAASHDIVVLLNNDMIVSTGFLDPLLEPFSDPDVFAVSSQIFFPEGHRREETGNTHGNVRHGYLHLSHEGLRPFHSKRETTPILWAGGGSSAFHRERFLQLGGFSKLYSPCYLEDTDLSYRAWRRGWKVLFAPSSRVLHKHRSSSKVRFTPQELESLVEERKLWYLWSNFQFASLLPHFILFPFNLTNHIGSLSYIRALRRLPAILLSRLSEPQRHTDDRKLESWIEHPLTFLDTFYPERRKLARSSANPLKILVVSAYLPHLGIHGGAGRVYQFLKRTSEEHEVTLIAFVENQSDEESVQQVEGFCKRIE
ncbi:MAG: glycosyltransferase family 2 protein, partial [bacterium]